MTARYSVGLWMVLVVLASIAASASAAEPSWPWMWMYAPCNFQVNERADEFIALMQRSRKAGYNAMLTSDTKFGRLTDRPKNYFANLERVRQAADACGMELIPCVMHVGYSNNVLQNNPNLAEGIPVRDCRMIVQGGKATVADAANLLPGGGFDEIAGKTFAGWDWADKCVSRDTAVKHGGAASAKMEKFGGENGRIVRKLAVQPWRQYRMDVWIKTQDISKPGDIRVAILAPDGRSMNFTDLGVKATQDWMEHHVLFNSLGNTSVNFYMGTWSGREGTLWLDDASVREVAGVNLLRRDGCPLKVTSDDGATVYAEGRDFVRWEYPKMGRVPYAGEYEVVHPEPPLVLPPGSKIRDGERLRVSFFHTVVIGGGQVCGCLRSEELFGLMEEEVRGLRKYWAPKTYFMSHDELRVAGWCDLCTAGGKTAGQVLAENAKRCTAIIRKVEPQARIFVWSDMFDPHHNAHDKYYLVAGTLEGSWEGLDPSVNIAAWYFGKRNESLAFFTGRGHKVLIAGYYDTSDLKANVDGWREAAAKVKGVEGFMYTTWQHKYKDVEEFARLVGEPPRP